MSVCLRICMYVGGGGRGRAPHEDQVFRRAQKGVSFSGTRVPGEYELPWAPKKQTSQRVTSALSRRVISSAPRGPPHVVYHRISFPFPFLWPAPPACFLQLLPWPLLLNWQPHLLWLLLLHMNAYISMHRYRNITCWVCFCCWCGLWGWPYYTR